MIALCIALVAALITTVYLAFQALRSERRTSARELDLRLNQFLHAVDKPWLPAPADEPAPASGPTEIEPRRYVPNIGQYPAE